MKRPEDHVLLFLLAGFLLLFCCLFFFSPAPDFSEEENRYLSARPDLSFQNYWNGQYSARFDTYITERMPGRRMMRSARALCELALGKREVRGVIWNRGTGLLRQSEESDTLCQKNLQAAQKLCLAATKTGIPFHAVLIPRRIDAPDAPLPAGLSVTSVLPGQIPETLKSKTAIPKFPVQAYYRTDHHLNREGAWQLYETVCAAFSLTPVPAEELQWETVCKDFYGTSAATSGIPFLSPDSVSVPHFKGEERFRITADGISQPGFYQYGKAATRDAYGVFFGGNFREIQIDRGETDDRPVLYVIKDSYANAVLPLLSLHFRIRAFDPRYGAPVLSNFSGDCAGVLLLCGTQTLSGSAFF